jgi:hypothetical protein
LSITFKKNIYLYINPKIRTHNYEPNENISYYSSYSNKINSSFYNDLLISGIGYKNPWFHFQIGRDRESWGAGNDIKIALSSFSRPYDYIMLGSNYGRIRVKYIHAFLEKFNKKNRYLNARGIEWSNNKNCLLGISEIVVYSGEDRNFDIGYLNPMSTHLEIDSNNRSTFLNGKYANAVWQFSSELMIKKKIRLSFNLLYDEFILDKIQKFEGKENGRALSGKIDYKIRDNLKVFSHIIWIGTPTFRHIIGTNNFIQKGIPLGSSIGSDGDEIAIGSLFKNNKYFSKLLFGTRRVGDESIIYRPYDIYEDYLKGDFPSGDFKNYIFLNAVLKYNFNPFSSAFILLDVHNDNYNYIISTISFGLKINFKNKNITD